MRGIDLTGMRFIHASGRIPVWVALALLLAPWPGASAESVGDNFERPSPWASWETGGSSFVDRAGVELTNETATSGNRSLALAYSGGLPESDYGAVGADRVFPVPRVDVLRFRYNVSESYHTNDDWDHLTAGLRMTTLDADGREQARFEYVLVAHAPLSPEEGTQRLVIGTDPSPQQWNRFSRSPTADWGLTWEGVEAVRITLFVEATGTLGDALRIHVDDLSVGALTSSQVPTYEWILSPDGLARSQAGGNDTGVVMVNETDALTWTSPDPVVVDTTYGMLPWVYQLKLAKPFSGSMEMRVGTWDPATDAYRWVGNATMRGESDLVLYQGEIQLSPERGPLVVSAGEHLAFQVLNTPDAPDNETDAAGEPQLLSASPSRTIELETGTGFTRIMSPTSDPGYPAPEVPSVVLLIAASVALGILRFRRRSEG